MGKHTLFLITAIILSVFIIALAVTSSRLRPKADDLFGGYSPSPSTYTTYEDCLAGDSARQSWCDYLLGKGLLSSPIPTATPSISSNPTTSPSPSTTISPSFAPTAITSPVSTSTNTVTPTPTSSQVVTTTSTPSPRVSPSTKVSTASPYPSSTGLTYYDFMIACSGLESDPGYPDLPTQPTYPQSSDFTTNGVLDIEAYEAALATYNNALDTYFSDLNRVSDIRIAHTHWLGCDIEWNDQHQNEPD